MNGRIATAVVLFFFVVLAQGCSTPEDQAGGTETQQPVVTEEAKSRGAITEAPDQSEPASPEIVVEDLTYEWRTSPETALSVIVDFLNPHETYERARGYVFLVATSSGGAGRPTGVFPWDAAFDGGVPVDFTDGRHLLFRKAEQVRATIPYKQPEGYYDLLRLIVYSEDGALIIDSTIDMEITGEATGPLRPQTTSTM